MISGRGLLAPASVAFVFGNVAAVAARVVRAQSHYDVTPARHDQTHLDRLNLGIWSIPVVIIAGMYGVFLLDALTRYPTGWDGLHYHLPVAVGWARTGNMNLINGLLHQSFPENGMIVPSLLLAGGLERPLTIVHLPKAVLLAAVIYGLARAAGAGLRGSAASVLITLSVPMVVYQSFSSYVDLYAAASWLSSLLALTWMSRVATERQRLGLLLLSGLSAGVALGSKTTFLVLVPILMGVVYAAERTGLLARRGPRRPLYTAVIFGAATSACSGFWFVRGTVQAGNPVYPLAVEVGGHRLLDGFTSEGLLPKRSMGSRILRWWDYPWCETKHSGTGYPYSTGNGVGAAYATFVPLALFATLIAGLRASAKSPARKWQVIFTALALGGPVLLVTIFSGMLRFVFPLLLVGIPATAGLIDRLAVRAERTTLSLLTAALALTATVTALLPAKDFLGRLASGTWQRAQLYDLPALIDRLEPGTRVLNLASPVATYPLLGKDLSNRVIAPTEWKLKVGESISEETLREYAIDYVYVRQPWPEYWPENLPVEKIYDDSASPQLATSSATRIYRVLEARDGPTGQDGRMQTVRSTAR